MISPINFDDYRKFILARIGEMPRRGYGQASRLARFLGVHTTLVSQILNGKKHLNLEQASLVAEFFGLTDAETEGFLLLVQLDRAGNESLRKNLRRRLERIRAAHRELSTRLQSDVKLTEDVRARFYSDWVYSAVRQLTAIKGFQTVDSIAEALGLPKRRTNEIVEFLLQSQLCVQQGRSLAPGVKSTHLESASPWLRMHHLNWRQKAMESLHRDEASKLHFTSPMTLSAADAARLREMIAEFLETLDKVIEPSPSEELRCLNIDWFKV